MVQASQEMILALILQALSFGFLLGIGYEFICIIRLLFEIEVWEHSSRARKKLSKGLKITLLFVGDLLFGVIVGVVSTLLIYHTNEGLFRGVTYIGMFLGYLFYCLTLKKIFKKISIYIIKLIKKIVHIAFIPLKFIIHILNSLYLLTIGKIIGKIIIGIKLKKQEKQKQKELSVIEENTTNENTGYKKEGRINFGQYPK